MAIQDDCIRKNPFEFKLSDVLEDDTEQKVILTPEQEEHLLAFMEKDKIYSKYYDEVVLLLETGLRISEFCGLTTHIDMQNKILNIDHQLLKDSEMGYYIETPKTKKRKTGTSIDRTGLSSNPKNTKEQRKGTTADCRWLQQFPIPKS